MSLYGPVDKTLTNRFINPDLASGGFTFPGSVISNGEMVVPDRPFPDVGISYGWTGTANNSESVELRGSQEVRRNLVLNPQSSSWLAQWGVGGAGVVETVGTMRRATWTTAPPAEGWGSRVIATSTNALLVPVAAGQWVAVAMDVASNVKASVVVEGYSGMNWVRVLWSDLSAVSSDIAAPSRIVRSALVDNAYDRLSIAALVGQGDAQPGTWLAAGRLHVAQASTQQAALDAVATYFDGDTVSTMDTLNNETIIIKAKNAGQYLRVGETIHQTRTDDEFIRATGTGDLLLSGGSWSGPVTIVPDRYKGDPFSGSSDYIYLRKDITARTSWEGAVNASPSIASYQVSEEWPRDIHWDDYGSRYYESGLDRGVLYLQDGTSVPWIGLREVNIDDYEGADISTYYVDGIEYLSVTSRGESKGTLRAFTSPEEFDRCAGYDTIHNGAYITGQGHEEFGLSYRTFAGNALGGPQAGYKIHLVYGVLAVPASLDYQTLSDDPNLIDLSWDIKATRVIFGTPPKSTAHVIIDTRYAYGSSVTALEKILYGADGPARLPSPDEVKTILDESAGLRVIDNGDGTFTLIAESEDTLIDNDDYFTVNWPTAVDLGNGRFEVSSL